jgi:hypothetical protein
MDTTVEPQQPASETPALQPELAPLPPSVKFQGGTPTPGYYKELLGGKVKVWVMKGKTLNPEEVLAADFGAAGTLTLLGQADPLPIEEIIAVIMVGTAIYVYTQAVISAPAVQTQVTLTITTEMMTPSQLASSAGPIPQLGPQDLKRGLPSGPINIMWGTLAWFSWCQPDNPQGPIWHVGWRKGEKFDGISVKIPSCNDFPPLSKANLLKLIRDFKDRLKDLSISDEEALAIRMDIEAFVSLLEKYLPWF